MLRATDRTSDLAARGFRTSSAPLLALSGSEAGATLERRGSDPLDAPDLRRRLEGPGGPARATARMRAEGATIARFRPRVADVRSLAATVDAALRQSADSAAILAAVRPELARFLANPKAVDPALIRPRADRYARTLLYRDPERRFVIALLTWSPGQKSPIHDHECWGAVGVRSGTIVETRYDLRDGKLRRAAPERADAGAITVVQPPETDLHTMENGGDELAVTIHIYGKDMRDANVYDPETGVPTRKPIGFDAAGPLASLD